jgi:hypothetical protein
VEAQVTKPPAGDFHMPLEETSVERFVPAGWKVSDQSQGDLNGDGIPDVLLGLDGLYKLKLVLLKGKNGNYHRVPADCVLSSRGIPTAMGGSVEVEINKGVLVISRDGGSSYWNATTWRFRFESSSQRFALIGKDDDSYNRITLRDGEFSSVNYLSGEMKVEKYHYKKDRRIVDSTRNSQVPKIKNTLRTLIMNYTTNVFLDSSVCYFWKRRY